MELQVVYYPSPVLREKARLIGEITDEIREIADAMLTLMVYENGIGLAASQVGISKRLFVVAYDDEGIPPMALINPRIVSRSKQQVFLMEGCLSFPGIFTELRRPESVAIVQQVWMENPSSCKSMDCFPGSSNMSLTILKGVCSLIFSLLPRKSPFGAN